VTHVLDQLARMRQAGVHIGGKGLPRGSSHPLSLDGRTHAPRP
jgi:hypothetical protein